MERKSIGSFIAALRRANGMTQKDLAERLMVSDKAVSRWERDESLPDLTLLPVIADIFNITVDELLRGERKADVSDMGNVEAEKRTESEQTRLSKQTRRVANAAVLRLRTKLVIAWGIGFAGVLAALICNFGFSRGLLGFFVGLICLTAAGGAVYLFSKAAWLTMDEEDYDADAVGTFRKEIVNEVKHTAIILAAMMAMIMPMLICLSGVNYGFTDIFVAADDYLLGVLLCLSLCMTVLSIAFYFANRRLTEKELYAGQPGLHGIILQVLCGVMAVTMIALPINYNSDYTVGRGKTFDNADDFAAYMEELWAKEREFAAGDENTAWIGDGDTATFNSGIVWYRTPDSIVEVAGENEKTEEELRRLNTRQLRDSNGDVIAEYLNPECVYGVTSSWYGEKDGWRFTVKFDSDYDYALNKRASIQSVLLVLLSLEPVIAGGVWLGLRRKK